MFWYNQEIEALEQKVIHPKSIKPRLLLYGSSSFRLWTDAAHDFPEFDVINQGFGGSTLTACAWFFQRLVPIYNPDILIIYAGDNDLGDGRIPEDLFFSFKGLMDRKNEYCGDIPMAFISVKPSLTREHLMGSIRYTNEIIEKEIITKHPDCTFINVFDEMLAVNQQGNTLYEDDGLHMSRKGYDLWQKIIRKQFLNTFINQETS